MKREQRAPRVSGLPGLFGPDPQDREDAEGPEGPKGQDVQDLLERGGVPAAGSMSSNNGGCARGWTGLGCSARQWTAWIFKMFEPASW